MEVNDFEILLIWCHVLTLTCSKAGINCANKKRKNDYKGDQWLKGLLNLPFRAVRLSVTEFYCL